MITGGGSGQDADFTISAPQRWRTPVTLRRRSIGFAKLGRSQAGFTIVETMIVLAITGVMLLSVIGLVSGRQNKTEFQQGINDVVTQLQQTAREVGIGYYPGLTNCSASSSGLTFNGSGGNQGANGGCIFLGKIIQFSPTSRNNGNEEYGAYTLAGCQFSGCSTTTSSPVSTSFTDAKPAIATAATSWYTLENGLSTVSMTYFCDSGVAGCDPTQAQPTRAAGFLQSFGTYGCNGGLCSGSQQADLYAVKVAGKGDVDLSENDVVQAVDTYGGSPVGSSLVPVQKLTICLKSGTTNQSGLITIGPTTSSVSLKIFDGGTCGA